MPIQFILTAVVLTIVIYAHLQRRQTYLLSEIITLVSLAAATFIWWPDLANKIAHTMGVGRGADLILYGLAVIGLAISLNLHLRERSTLEKVTELTRVIAIQNVKLPKGRQWPIKFDR